jgi:hypothetical protein
MRKDKELIALYWLPSKGGNIDATFRRLENSEGIDSLDQTRAMRVHIHRELKKQMGEQEFGSLHYLEKELVVEKYFEEHEAELMELYPKADVTML